MAGLKELRTRIESIKSTQKITSAMKMVAAARLRRSQDMLAKAQNYNDSVSVIAGRLYKDLKEESRNGKEFSYPPIMQPKAEVKNYLLIVFSSDRGLCGSYNSYVLRETIRRIDELRHEGKNVKVLCMGKKVGDTLRGRRPEIISEIMSGVGAKGAKYKEIEHLIEPVLAAYMLDEIDACEVIYTHFESAINREVRRRQFLPFEPDVDLSDPRYDDKIDNAFFGYDAPKDKVFNDVIFMLAMADMFAMFLSAQASEHGARMTSMDNATRNANDMVSRLTLRYNRLRQGAITTELIEIISGAEAL